MMAGRVQMDRHREPFSVQARASSDGNPKCAQLKTPSSWAFTGK